MVFTALLIIVKTVFVLKINEPLYIGRISIRSAILTYANGKSQIRRAYSLK